MSKSSSTVSSYTSSQISDGIEGTFPVILSQHAESSGAPVFYRDAHVIQEILDNVEKRYYSMTFDSGRYEIEHSAGPNCRELANIKTRLMLLDKQNKAVSWRVSELILNKHPRYEAELNGVLSLQTDNLETLELCRHVRQSLKLSADVLVLSRLTVLRNFRRQSRLYNVLRVLMQLRTLQSSVCQLDSLLHQGNFHAAIGLHRDSRVCLEHYGQYRCVEPIRVKLKALGLRIDYLLDTELQKNCEHFSPVAYATVQRAFELLGSTQTMFAQLQVHFIAAIHRHSFAIVQSHLNQDHDVETQACSSGPTYTDLCQRLTVDVVPTCLSNMCQKLWVILLCYHQSMEWHKQRASANHVYSSDTAVSQSTTDMCHPSVDGDVPPVTVPSASNGDEDGTCQSQLIRSWHEYVAGKLAAGRSHIWSEIIARVEPLLSALGKLATQMSFDGISAVLQTINHFVKIGEDFCGSPSPELLEILRNSIQQFFNNFHCKHLDRLRMFLENERWERCPVSSSFTILDLQEFRPLSRLFDKSDVSVHNRFGHAMPKKTDNARTTQSFFNPPYQIEQFRIRKDNNADDDSHTNSTLPLSHKSADVADKSVTSTESDATVLAPWSAIPMLQKDPIFPNTTLEVLRLIGRYMQMMLLLRPIAADVMHCLCQVFDYYLYSIFIFFGPAHLLESSELPERLRLTLKRISERVVDSHDSRTTAKRDRFLLPVHEPIRVTHTDTWDEYLSAHCVGVESVVWLADILEQILLPHLSSCLPERKRGLTSVFREQSLTAARQLRETCAMHAAPHLIKQMMPARTSPSSQTETAPSTNTGINIASSLIKIWPGGSNTANAQSDSSTGARAVLPTPASNARGDCATDINVLTPYVTASCWTSKNVADHPSDYVNQLHQSVIMPFAAAIQRLTQRLGLCEQSRTILWNALLTCISNTLLNAFSQVHLCTEEGRSQMLLDVQSIAVFTEKVGKLRTFPRMDHVIDYIQAFYIPVHEWDQWLSGFGAKYTRSQLTGLAHCLAHGDRRQKQRLLNAISQLCNNNHTTSTTTVGSGCSNTQ